MLPYPVIPKSIIRPKTSLNSPRRSTSSTSRTRAKTTRKASPSLKTSRNVICNSEKLVPLRLKYAEMSEMLHNFTSECTIDDTSPELMIQFKTLDIEYEKFCLQINGVLGSINPSTPMDKTLVTSTTVRQGQVLTAEWRLFIRKFNQMSAKGLMPHFLNLSNQLKELKNSVKIVISLFSGNLLPSINPNLVKKIYSDIDHYQKYFFGLYRRVEFGREFEYNATQAILGFKKMFDLIGSIFDYKLPSLTMSTADVMRKKTEVAIQCEVLTKLVEGTGKFSILGNETVDKITEVNQEFKNLFEFVKIPYELDLKFNEEEEVSELMTKEENKKISAADELMRKSQKAVDSMRKRIQEIEKTLFIDHLDTK